MSIENAGSAENAGSISGGSGDSITRSSESPNARQYAFLFCDLVNSTGIKNQLNAWSYVCHILEPHDSLFRKLLTQYPEAYEIKHLGDGFLAVFKDVRDAVSFALRFHEGLSQIPWKLDGLDIKVETRIGIDVGFAVIMLENEVPIDVFGPNVDVASRVMSAGDGGRTLLTATACDLASPARTFIDMHLKKMGLRDAGVQLVRHGEYRIQGIAQPVMICEACLSTQTPSPPRSAPPKVVNIADEDWQPENSAGVLNPSDIPDRPRWRLTRKLGEGSFGTVYLVTDLDNPANQRVLKFCRGADTLESFRNEIQLFKQIKHLRRGDIVDYYGSHLERPPFFIEFEYVEAGNLWDWSIAQGGLATIPLPQRLELFTKIARAVAAAHRERIFHLDLMPANILMARAPDGSWQPKLADFGMGRRERAGSDPLKPTTPRSGDPVGSQPTIRHAYTAPEVSHATLADSASPDDQESHTESLMVRDVYALGVLLFQLAVGDLQRPLSPSAIRLVFPRQLREDIEAATHFNPAERLSSAAELERRVAEWRSREHRRFLLSSIIPAAASLIISLVFVSTLCVLFYQLYSETHVARQEALEAKEQVEQSYEDKLKALTRFWRDNDGEDDLPLHAQAQSEVQRIQLLREIRRWVVQEADEELAELQFERSHRESMLAFARLTLQKVQLSDDAPAAERLVQLEEGLKTLKQMPAPLQRDPELRLLLTDFESQMGQLSYGLGNLPAALAHFQESLKERLTLKKEASAAKTGPSTVKEGQPVFPLPVWEYDRRALISQHNVAAVRLDQATRASGFSITTPGLEYQAAQSQLQDVLDQRQQLATTITPPSAILLRDWARSEYGFGRMLRESLEQEPKDSPDRPTRVELARQTLTSALAHLIEAQSLAGSASIRQNVVETLQELVDLELDEGNLLGANQYRDELVQQAAYVLPAMIRDLSARSYLTDARFSLKQYQASQRPEDFLMARADLSLSYKLYGTLIKIDSTNPRLWGELGLICDQLATLLAGSNEQKDHDLAPPLRQEALAAWSRMRQIAPEEFEREYAVRFAALQKNATNAP